MAQRATPAKQPSPELAIADRLNSAAIHLLRRLRRQDPASGLSAARLSAMSMIVWGGPVSLSELAEAEQVQLPTASRLVAALEHEGLVTRESDPEDGRSVRIRATAKGRKICIEGRMRRVRALAEELRALAPGELEVLGEASLVLERLLGEHHHELAAPGDS